MRKILPLRLVSGILLGLGVGAGIVLFGQLGGVRTVFADSSLKPFLPLQVSTIPSNGDTTPYGLAFVPHDFPDDASISPGELLVSNFNNTTTAGQGTTIITVDPRSGKTGLFFQGNSPIGFTNALTIARVGLVFAGSLPTSGGTAEPGPLDVFDAKGNLLTQLGSSHLVDGPWGMALNDRGNTAQLFVSNIFDTKNHFAGSITRLTSRCRDRELPCWMRSRSLRATRLRRIRQEQLLGRPALPIIARTILSMWPPRGTTLSIS